VVAGGRYALHLCMLAWQQALSMAAGPEHGSKALSMAAGPQHGHCRHQLAVSCSNLWQQRLQQAPDRSGNQVRCWAASCCECALAHVELEAV
jgi:hypothetical protein